MNTLTYGVTVVTLPDDMLWPDEFTWRAIEQKTSYGVTGALFVESALKLAGRTIEMQAGEGVWMTRATLIALYALAQIPGATMVLLLRGQTFNVKFDHATNAIAATPLVDYSDPDAADQYLVTLKFITMP